MIKNANAYSVSQLINNVYKMQPFGVYRIRGADFFHGISCNYSTSM